ncbi:MAG: hypothetical protein U9R39_04435 [Campylobacterota bacterium]|nr:hypothetical protein [Campylobacterota bacterium]
MKKKAFINIILLGFILISSVVVFVSTTADDITWKNKYFNLKKITDNSVLALAKHYNEHNSVQDAQDIANGILSNSKLGRDALDYITYTWDFDSEPNSVKATITNYKHKSFWYKFLGKDEFIFKSVESQAQMIDSPLEQVGNFVPLAVNGCENEYNDGDEFDFLLKAYDLYQDDDYVGFFGLYDPSGGQSSFAHLKNLVDDVIKDKTSDFDVTKDVVSIVSVLSEDINNDVKQISQSFGIDGFEKKDMTIVVLDCESTADEPVVQKLLPITMNSVACAQCCKDPFMGFCMPSIICTFVDKLNDLTGDVFSDMIWASDSNTCNKNELFTINFEVLPTTKSTVKLIN